MTVTDLPIGKVIARFNVDVNASLSSTLSGLVSPSSLTFSSTAPQSFTIDASTRTSGSILVFTAYTYDGSISIVLKTPLREATVLGPYRISSIQGSEILDATITITPGGPTGFGKIVELVTNPIVLLVIIVVIVGVAIVKRR